MSTLSGKLIQLRGEITAILRQMVLKGECNDVSERTPRLKRLVAPLQSHFHTNYQSTLANPFNTQHNGSSQCSKQNGRAFIRRPPSSPPE